MPLEKWHPLKELEGMRKEMERIWDEVFPAQRRVTPEWRGQTAKGTAVPPIDIIDRADEVLVKAEMPGVTRENIDISLQENTLTIKGEIKDGDEEKAENCTYCERDYRYYARSINIPFKITSDRIKANLKDGILYIHLPKAVEAQPRKITVEVS